MELKGKLSGFTDTNWLVYALFVVFGMSSWVDTYGIWVEMPILVQYLPEGWSLPSYMTVATQIANIAPIIYVAVSSRFPNRRLEIPVSYVIIGIGIASCILLAFLWRTTSYIAGAERSSALIGLQFTLALVDTTSSVTYLPFLSHFKTQYVTSFFVGEGFSALVPSLIALIQGVGTMTCEKDPIYQNSSNTGPSVGPSTTSTLSQIINASTVPSVLLNDQTEAMQNYTVSAVYQEPKFSVQIFFFVLAIILLLSGISFTLLNYWSYCLKEYAENPETSGKAYTVDTKFKVKTLSYNSINSEGVKKPQHPDHQIYPEDTETKDNGTTGGQHDDTEMGMEKADTNENDVKSGSEALADSDKRTMTTTKFWTFLVLTSWLTFLIFGILPTIQTYSCLPYGLEPYHLTVTLTNIAHPLSAFMSMFLRMKSLRNSLVMAALATGLCGYIMWTAVASPEPPLVDHSAGPVILIICWVLSSAIINFTRVSIATVCSSEGKMALMWVGAWTQIGSLTGAIVGFCLVNFTTIFEEANPCL